jgi:hypothetical protein
MQDKIAIINVWVLVQVVNPLCIKEGRAAFDTVYNIIFGEQEFGKIGSVLSCDASDKGYFLHL